MLFGFLGIIVAYMMEYLNTHGYVIDEYLQQSISLVDLQICIVILFILFGIVVAVVTS